MPIETLNDKVTIRMADIVSRQDVEHVFKLIDDYDGVIKCDREITKKHALQLMQVSGVVLAEYNGQVIGAIAACAAPCMFQDEVFVNVMFINVRKDFRHLTKQFIKEFELTLLATKCTMITFAAPAAEFFHASAQLKRFFRILGYKELEVQYYKRLVKNAD